MDPICRRPVEPAEWEACYRLRWQVLRAPWGQPPGSERDEHEADAEHRCCLLDGEVVAVGRVHGGDGGTGRIRFMAVAEEQRGRGLGAHLLTALEEAARRRGWLRLELNAREDAAAFYRRHGYVDLGPGPLLFGSIPHRRMAKDLAGAAGP